MREDSGRSLIEIIGVLAIGAVMMAATYSIYHSTNEKQKRFVASETLKDIVQKTKTLLEYTFEKNVRGYNAYQVDSVLDKVIEDLVYYETSMNDLNNKCEKLGTKCVNLEVKVKSLELENAKLQNQLPSLKNDKNVSRENVNLLKRIDALEKALYPRGVDPSRIK